jgi:hypothetical protein
LNTAPIDLEQLHNDAAAAVETFKLGRLDFAPRCDFHRVYHSIDVPATHSFKCRNCKVVELRCTECVEYFAAIPHTPTECEQCSFAGCFHAVVQVLPLGVTS